MFSNQAEKMRNAVRSTYADIAKKGGSCCGPMMDCCSGQTTPSAEDLGYSRAQTQGIPEGTDLGLGCGNPHAIASLNPGETVLDLGSGPGLDCLIAAEAVGEEGQVIGVDMTAEMIERARANGAKVKVTNVEFRLGEIEHLPVADSSVDVIMSNCVINLAIDKVAVYREAFRVLKSGGRLAIADMVATEPLAEADRQDAALYAGCISGAATIDETKTMLTELGFGSVEIDVRLGLEDEGKKGAGESDFKTKVVSATIEAVKP